MIVGKQIWVHRKLGGMAAAYESWEPSRQRSVGLFAKINLKNKATYVKWFTVLKFFTVLNFLTVNLSESVDSFDFHSIFGQVLQVDRFRPGVLE